MTNKPEFYNLVTANPLQYNPTIVAIWSYYQDDGFGNLIDTRELCFSDPGRTNYIINYLGYDSVGTCALTASMAIIDKDLQIMNKTSIVDKKTGNSYRMEFEYGSGRHRLVNTFTGTRTEWAAYCQFTYLEGYVGATCFFLREAAILTAEEFCGPLRHQIRRTKIMEVKAISLEATEVTDNAFVAHIKHNGRLVVLEVNAAGELVISMSPAYKEFIIANKLTITF